MSVVNHDLAGFEVDLVPDILEIAAILVEYTGHGSLESVANGFALLGKLHIGIAHFGNLVRLEIELVAILILRSLSNQLRQPESVED
ncbi:unnamed protein product [Clonostachys rhizophaga]|uniref:Uncharacterized protein n=1 Tax=Clonostachys rhizophaga TaxID=160324 RepID=A0A9N9YSD8_9HYPO|nr:unnamed protein product [Clonostachys rhizophaga]